PGHRLVNPVLALFRHAAGRGVWIGIFLITAAAFVSLRHALFAVFQLSALFAYAWLEFERRHVFYLEIVSVLGLLVAASLVWRMAAGAVRHRSTPRSFAPGIFPSAALGRALAVPAVTALLIFASVGTARAYQQTRLERMFRTYIDAPRMTVHP